MSVDLSTAKGRFSSAGFERSDRYEEGAVGKGQAWNAAKNRAKTNYGPAMQQALQDKSYESGLDKADAGDYDNGVATKGVQNWPVGMQASADKWEERVQPFVSLWDASLPTSRGPKGSAANLKRMNENAMLFRDKAK